MSNLEFTGATCFSGIGAPELGGPEFNWKWCAEIEPFPAAVLAERFGASAPRFMPSPDDVEVWISDEEAARIIAKPKSDRTDSEAEDLEPYLERQARRAAIKAVSTIKGGTRSVNFGDVSNPDFIAEALKLGPIDLLVGGPPCQAFSFAGLRASLEDDRGNLSLRFVEIAHAIRPRILLVENVPGWLSTKDNAFGCFLGAIVGANAPLPNPLGGKWPDSGMVAGPRARVAWRIFDAQHFGLAQRRRRVFAVVSFGDDDPSRILFERQSMLGSSKKSRQARKEKRVAGTLNARAQGGGGLGTDFELDGGLQPVAARMLAFGEYSIDETASTIKARDWKDATGLVISAPPELAATLRAEGFDATEDGSGRTTLIPEVVGTICADSFSGGFGGRPEGAAAGHIVPIAHVDKMPTMTSGGPTSSSHGQASGQMRDRYIVPVAFSSKDDGSDAQEDIAPTLRAMNNVNSKPNGGGQMAVAFDLRGREGGSQFEGPHETANIRAASGGSSRSYILTELAVRKLTPVECERLQGFPDNFTAIEGTKRRKVSPEMRDYLSIIHGLSVTIGEAGTTTTISADAPRYKSLGNSWAVKCGRWIINRIYLEMKGELA